MDATQQIEDSFLGDEDESDNEHEQTDGKTERKPLAVLKVFKNNHIPETEVPLYQGENVLGREPTSCSVPLQARSVSGHHAIICISVTGPKGRHAHSEPMEALLWDLGSLNGTRKGRLKLTPHVRYALTDGDGVVLADLPCQYVSLKDIDWQSEKVRTQTSTSSSTEGETVSEKGNSAKNAFPPVPAWSGETKSLQSILMTPKQPEMTLVPESDSDSDGEKRVRRERRIVASDSVFSDLFSPRCSTFLTPATKIIPESEDESSITPSPALRGTFQKPENDTEVSSGSSKPDPLHFDIDSDTDVEDDDGKMTKATLGSEAAVQDEVAVVNPADPHMDSDTDVEEEPVDKGKSDPEASGLASAKHDRVNPAVLNMDSDTDNEDDGVEMAKAAIPVEVAAANPHMDTDTDIEEEAVQQDPEALGLAPAKQDQVNPAALIMDSDTDVEEDEPMPGSVHAVKIDTGTSAQFHLDSDTDVEDEEAPRIQPCAMNTDHLASGLLHPKSDSDTDVEDDVTENRSPTVVKERGNSQSAGEHSTDVQCDGPVRVQPPAEDLTDEFKLDSDTEGENDEEKMAERDQMCADAGRIVHSSTPRGAGLSQEEKETQAFLSPSQLFKRPGLPSLFHPSVSPGSVSQADDDFAVAETQSFMCDAARADATLDETPQLPDDFEPQRPGGALSLQLGPLDSSHHPKDAEEHHREGHVLEEDWQLQETQLYALKNSEGGTKAGQTPDLDATQGYAVRREEEEEEEQDDGRKDERESEMQPPASPSCPSIHSEPQFIKPNEDEEKVHNEMQVDSHLSTADTLLIIRSPVREEQPQPNAFLELQQENDGPTAQNEKIEGRESAVTSNDLQRDEAEKKEQNETRPMCEEDDEQQNEPSTSSGTWSHHHTRTAGAIAETLPVCEEEEDEEEEEEIKNRSAKVAGVTQEELSHALSTKRTSMRRLNAKTKLGHVTVPDTLPLCDDEEEQQSKAKSVRKSQRVKRSGKVEAIQPMDTDSTTESTNMREEEEVGSRRSLRGKVASGGRDKAEKDKNCEEEGDGANKRRKKNLRLKSKNDDKTGLGFMEVEHEKSDGLENDHSERERTEQEKQEREAQERREMEMEGRLEREKRSEEERSERERLERENEEKEKLEKETGERLTRDKKKNEKQEKEMASKEDGAAGRRKAQRKGGRKGGKEEEKEEEGAKNIKEELSIEQKHECVEEAAEADLRPRRGRRTARKSAAPPAAAEDEGGPAKRTRSRSNSSNSVCSEQSVQDSFNGGGRRGRRVTTVPSSDQVTAKQDVHSRSTSRSSERSSSGVAAQSQGRGAKRSKGGKTAEPEEERKRSTATGRGRGKGRSGKRPGANELTGNASDEDEMMAVASDDSVMSQSSSSRGRKRAAGISKAEPPPPIPKTPRRSSTGTTHKVLFTGVADEDGEKVVVRLGGGLAKGVSDMTHLVTDKVRRTVKFLCAVARGVPIVTPDWLSKCGKAGSFLSPNGFLVEDVEQETRFNFRLQDALRAAGAQPLLQGYEIHVTPSVRPEPAQMKEIIMCCGARFLPRMPSAHKAQVVVVSCEEDRALGERAQSLAFPVVSAEFLLTGILQQKVDTRTHALSLSPVASAPKPNARKRGK